MASIRLSLALATSICAGARAQAPDLLVPGLNLDGLYRLTDTNADGLYDQPGEAYDYFVETDLGDSIRDLELLDSSLTGGDPELLVVVQCFPPGAGAPTNNIILRAWDTNGDGRIDPATETMTAFDSAAALGDPQVRLGALEHVGNGVFYTVNDRGTLEGIYRIEDTNNDGDFMDPGEFAGVFVEPATLPITNAPNSAPTTLSGTGIQSIEFDPTVGASGRFLIEDENRDQSIALEDKNGDGDFDDADECYLFAGIFTGGLLGADASPEIGVNVPNISEARDHEIDTSGVSPVYYILSTTTGSSFGSACILMRGIDGNGDGDINDAGELNTFFDCSLDSTFATIGYNFTLGMELHGGDVYLIAEFDDAVEDMDRCLRLTDLNADGDANDAGEAVVVWDSGFDNGFLEVFAFDAGTLPPAATGTAGSISTFGSETCMSSTPDLHTLTATGVPVPGFTIGWDTAGAAASSAGVIHIGFMELTPGVPLDAGTCVFSLNPDASLPFVTDATGMSSVSVMIPAGPSSLGLPVHAQSIVADLGINAFNVTLSGGTVHTIGGFTYTPNP